MKIQILIKKIYIDQNLRQLIQLALPVIATSFMTMAYNCINIIFVGRLGSEAVAAVGSAGFFMNLSWAIASLLTVGVGIKVSHAIGEREPQLARSYIRSGIQATLIVSVVYFLFVAFTRTYLISIVGLNNPDLERLASRFLLFVAVSIPFSFQNLFFTSVFIGYGDSRTPFRINTTSFLLNIIFDYIFIFQAQLGINGAALGTVLAQGIATILFHYRLNQNETLRYQGIKFHFPHLKNILSLGMSPTIQRVSFTLIAIGMARIISHWGAPAIAVQKIGIQVEAISYMTAGGFMSALATISGQAYGAGNYQQMWKAFRSGMFLALVIGVFASGLLICFPRFLFSLFVNEKDTIEMGIEYLIILGFSQLFMCLELMATGAFFGWGRTNVPAFIGISLTLLRIPMALLFIQFWQNSLASVWWSISISSIAKGTLLVVLYIMFFKSFLKNHNPVKS